MPLSLSLWSSKNTYEKLIHQGLITTDRLKISLQQKFYQRFIKFLNKTVFYLFIFFYKANVNEIITTLTKPTLM